MKKAKTGTVITYRYKKKDETEGFGRTVYPCKYVFGKDADSVGGWESAVADEMGLSDVILTGVYYIEIEAG